MRPRGFTLVEVLVAVAILALLSVMAWRALDGMLTARRVLSEHADNVLALEAGLNQWGTDLDRISETAGTTPLDWDGRVLRITRTAVHSETGLQVVAWSRGERDGKNQWLRWQSAPVRDTVGWRTAWLAAAAWGQGTDVSARKAEVSLAGSSDWQLYYFRGGSWSNALSSDGTPGNATVRPVPDGVRLALEVATPHPLAGTIIRDWARPTLSADAP